MTTLTTTLTGGNHLTFTLSGAKSATVQVALDELSQPITDEDAVTFCKIIARMAKAGRTMNQARALLQTGVVVVV